MTVAPGSRLGPEDLIAGDTTLWTYDPKRAIESKLTTSNTTSASWSPDEIFFVDSEGDLQAVPYRLTATSLEPGTARRLFAFPPDSAHDVTLDGQKILLSAAAAQSGERQWLHVLVGWNSRLAQR